MSLLAAVERIRTFAGPAEELWALARPVLESGAFTDRKVAVHALARHAEIGSLVPAMLDAVAERSDPALRTGVVGSWLQALGQCPRVAPTSDAAIVALVASSPGR